MKKFIVALLMILSFSALAEERNVVVEAKQQAQQIVKECEEKYLNGNINLYSGIWKKAYQKTNKCVKKYTIREIKKMGTAEDQKNLIDALNRMEESTTAFYWYLFNFKDNGLIGQMQNDAAWNQELKNILEDVIQQKLMGENS